MARIRTIKPEFFTSEDIVSLSYAARLLYIALWCECDREGRLTWRPATFKLRYFPGDKVNIDTLAREILARGLVVEYGEGLAYIPTFLEHQHVNPREAQSSLPVPDASARVTDAQVGREGREGKGKEGVEAQQRSRGSRLPPDWQPSEVLKAWACKERDDLNIEVTIEKFRDYWHSKPGSAATKLDWEKTFKNWVRGEKQGNSSRPIDYDALAARIEQEDQRRASNG